MIHELKCLPAYFDATWRKQKPFELRKNDRNFRPGDVVILEEWTEKGGYTKRSIVTTISYIIQDEQWLKPGVCCIGLHQFEFIDGADAKIEYIDEKCEDVVNQSPIIKSETDKFGTPR